MDTLGVMVSTYISTEFHPERVWSDEDYKKLLYMKCYVVSISYGYSL